MFISFHLWCSQWPLLLTEGGPWNSQGEKSYSDLWEGSSTCLLITQMERRWNNENFLTWFGSTKLLECIKVAPASLAVELVLMSSLYQWSQCQNLEMSSEWEENVHFWDKNWAKGISNCSELDRALLLTAAIIYSGAVLILSPLFFMQDRGSVIFCCQWWVKYELYTVIVN